MTYILAASHWSRIRRLYGLTQEEFQILFDAQKGRCPICDRGFTPKRYPCVDHDHKTGLIRGLLCNVDNHGLLGTWGENPEFYRRAGEYLSTPPAPAIIGEHYHADAPPRTAERPPRKVR